MSSKNSINKSLVIIAGDIHGGWFNLCDKLVECQVEDACVIQVGDFGIGFNHDKEEEKLQLSLVNENFKERNNHLLVIRGNHDNPSYFNGRYKFSNLELLKDYTTIKINGEKFLFVGGGLSLDRTNRVIDVSYWLGEEVALIPNKVKKCDVLITHAAPSWNGANDKNCASFYNEDDPTLYAEAQAERKVIDQLITLSKAKYHYCGHMHEASLSYQGKTRSRIVNILELVEHRKYNDD